MQVVILAGGLATRMEPLTMKIPKSMVDINGKPLLWYQLELLKQQGINDIIVCVGHLGDQIITYFGNGLKYSVEKEEPLGTAGAVKNIPCDWLEHDFIVLYGDIIFTIDLKKMFEFHKQKDAVATIHIHTKPILGSSSIRIDKTKRITEFVEKPTKLKKPNWVNSGIYIMNKRILGYIPAQTNFDFGKQLFPLLIEKKKRLYGYPLKKREYWKEVGTVNRLEEFIRFFPKDLNINKLYQ